MKNSVYVCVRERERAREKWNEIVELRLKEKVGERKEKTKLCI